MTRIAREAPRRAVVTAGVLVAVGLGIGIWLGLFQGGASAREVLPFATATRGNVVVSVGGLGRVVERRAAGLISVGSGSSSTSGSSGGSSSPRGSGTAPADAVFPRTSARVARFLVAAGQHVKAGQPLAVLDDGGVAEAAVRQAETDVAAAELEERLKQTHDPSRGLPATPEELTAATLAVEAARAKLARIAGPGRPAEIAAARADLKRAQSDYEVLRGGSPAALADAIAVARRNVQYTQQKLNRLLAPPSPADVSAAEAELTKAEADLAVLKRPAQPALPAAIAAAEEAVSVAKQKLAKLTGPPDPAAVAGAQADVKRAEADLEALLRPDRTQPVTQKEIDAAKAALDAARVRLAKLLAAPDPADVAAAEYEVKKAEAELAALRRSQPAALPEQVAAAKAAVDAAKRKLAKLLGPPNSADVQAARLDLQKAQGDLRRLLGGPSPTARRSARQAIESARAKLAQLLGPALNSDVEAARADVRKAEADLAVLRARGGPASALEIELAAVKVKAAKARLVSARVAQRLLTVRAPDSGTVTSLLTVRGAPVDATTPIASVVDLDHVAVNVDLSEFDVAQVKLGLRALVRVDALGGKAFAGKVLYAAPVGNDASGIVTFPVRVSLHRGDGVRPGMNVSVKIIVAQRRHVIVVPLEAVSRNDEDQPIVLVLGRGGEAVPRKVKLGLANNKSVEIRRGLRVGERVLLPEAQGGGGNEE
jgi:HlyD family secretion protein